MVVLQMRDFLYRASPSVPVSTPERGGGGGASKRKCEQSAPSTYQSTPWTVERGQIGSVMRAIDVLIEQGKPSDLLNMVVFDTDDAEHALRHATEVTARSTGDGSIQIACTLEDGTKFLTISKILSRFLRERPELNVQVQDDCWFQALVNALHQLGVLNDDCFQKESTQRNSSALTPEVSEQISAIVTKNNEQDTSIKAGAWESQGFHLKVTNEARETKTSLSNYKKVASLLSTQEVDLDSEGAYANHELVEVDWKSKGAHGDRLIYVVEDTERGRYHAVSEFRIGAEQCTMVVDPANCLSYPDIQRYMERKEYDMVMILRLVVASKRAKTADTDRGAASASSSRPS